MNYWFYAVLSETAGSYSVAVKSTSIDAAKAKLARQFPHAVIIEIERGEITA